MRCACVHCEMGIPSMCMVRALNHKSQTVAVILQNPAQASLLEDSLAERGLRFYEVRPSVFTIEPIPQYLRSST